MDKGKRKYFLGVDGGATQNKAVIIDENGQVLGKGESKGGNYHVIGLQGLAKNLQQSIFEASKEAKIEPRFTLAVFGLAGCDSKQDEKILRELISQKFSDFFPQFLVVNDIKVALRSGTKDPFGVVVISGTGSNMYARNRNGEEALASGLDYILTDDGAAYDIGLRVLRAAVKSFDGREEKSLLEEMAVEKLQVQNMREATDKVYNPSLSKPQIASFAPLAEGAARRGDKKANEILTIAARELFLGARAVIERVKMEKERFDLVLVGSVFENKIVLSQFQNEASKAYGGIRFIFPKIVPAEAAAFLAQEEYAKMEKR